MRKMHRRRRTALVIVAAMAVSVTGCTLLPHVPRDVPISMSLDHGVPVMKWCAEEVQVRELKVYEGIKERDRSELVMNVTGGPILEGGDSLPLGVQAGSSVWTKDDWTGLSPKSDLLGITIRVLRGSGKEYTLMAEFYVPSDAPPRHDSSYWIWATGEISHDPCGMASAR